MRKGALACPKEFVEALTGAPRSMGRCAGSASRITLVPSFFNAPSKSGGPRYEPVPIIDELLSAAAPPVEELGYTHVTVALANLIALFDQESLLEWEFVREWDLEDLDMLLASELEYECMVVPVAVACPSLELVVGLVGMMAGDIATP
jgi:hypothetical protein